MPTAKPRKPPGRPRAFSEDAALDAAMRVFAAKGFEAASLADLTAAMGINRVSMYATFGNKEALFTQALARYTAAGTARFAEALAAPAARDAVERFLRISAEGFTAPGAAGVCFITQPPLAGGEASAETRAFVACQRAEVEGMLARRLAADPALAAPADLARFYAVVVQGMALQAQHGGTADELGRVVATAMAAWPAGAPS